MACLANLVFFHLMYRFMSKTLLKAANLSRSLQNYANFANFQFKIVFKKYSATKPPLRLSVFQQFGRLILPLRQQLILMLMLVMLLMLMLTHR